ncbi:carbohydrate ABC transporter permease [Paenibacillus sp. PAMC21692]|uniref:carbohydrate ABC transporter permease n=1 Tax=Paenibacillus sp. PAMC21692 TaxID=2762320 RepID=UPI00164D3303|nr:carbohydrate ABC transporter permease [Paenibacillus sp. PAMC21692]QNK58808.1 carbohydrate ABC transporter permease [Paenibacillus sp. PAMC21692]
MKKSISAGSRLFDGVNNLWLLLVLIATLYPFLHVAAVSLSDPFTVLQNKVTFYPIGLDLNSYQTVLENPALWTSYRNTIVYTVSGTLINLVLTTLMAYALSKPKLYARKTLTMMVIFTMFFQGGMIPSYLVVNELGIMNSMWAVILPYAVSTWNLMIMRTFFQGFPQELEEAAVMDGGNPYQILLRIVVPLSKPIMATMALFYSVWHWNSYMLPLLYLNEKVKYPLQILLQQILISGETSFAQANANIDSAQLIIGTSIKYATIMVAILPIILIYPFVQKYFVKGAMMGSIKG